MGRRIPRMLGAKWARFAFRSIRSPLIEPRCSMITFHSTSKGTTFKKVNISHNTSVMKCATRWIETRPPSSSEDHPKPPPESKAKEETQKVGKLRKLWNTYGWTGVAVYSSLWVGFLGGFWVLTGFYDLMPAINWVRSSLGFSTEDSGELFEKYGRIAVAYLATEISEVVRIPLTLAITPFIAKLLRKGK